MAELKQKRICLNGLGERDPEIGLLIGVDSIGGILTGKVVKLANGFTAFETVFGWTVMGQSRDHHDADGKGIAITVTSMMIRSSTIDQLWRLDTIGIMDPAESKIKQETEADVLNLFLQTVTREENGRYTVALPWIDRAPLIPDKKMVAERRLESMTRKLRLLGKYDEYDAVLNLWLDSGIIEEVPVDQISNRCHYLPHRALLKSGNTTTPVRPVLDASCKADRNPSLNEYLEKGPNLLESMPSILPQFREGKIGVTSDITKAFLMVNVQPKDRDYLRFL